MKFSLAWAFDHIDADWQAVDVPELVAVFNSTTAEIESWRKVTLLIQSFFLAQVTTINDDYVIVYSPELKKEFKVSLRTHVYLEQWYLMRVENGTCSWATISDVGGEKEGILPALQTKETLQVGAWKENIEINDYILDIDNKSITNRPDLWGHRGLAREIAAILGKPLKPLTMFLQEKKNYII